MYFHNGRGGRWDSDSSDSEGNVKPSVQWQFGGKDSGNYHRVAQGSGHYDNVAANTLNVASTAKVEGNLKTNALSIDLGAEVSGSITRIS